jgi:hypothetical protein
MNITRIKDHDDVYRDLNSNAILFKNSDDSIEKRNRILRGAFEDINNLKKEVSELRQDIKSVLDFLKTRENNK